MPSFHASRSCLLAICANQGRRAEGLPLSTKRVATCNPVSQDLRTLAMRTLSERVSVSSLTSRKPPSWEGIEGMLSTIKGDNKDVDCDKQQPDASPRTTTGHTMRTCTACPSMVIPSIPG